ncbi:MAG: hypothetical protein AAFN94_00915 [Pseudomonadota bacterium]
MRELSLQSDLEHEVWLLLKELTDEHGLSLKEAVERVAAANQKNMRDMQHEIS